MTEEYIQICFGIISQVGVARSLYVEAVRKARAGEFDAIEGLQKEA
ncbi:MAG: PTS lactose/cellobiose transporter subunit IIA, partial [Erysipelotrichaceae bacterium]|nr:PTS lactose/cellobiose transporter subunit IIA [Erysipelotrichaceae bacterium]